jgi:hypothetical protein
MDTHVCTHAQISTDIHEHHTLVKTNTCTWRHACIHTNLHTCMNIVQHTHNMQMCTNTQSHTDIPSF